MPPTTEPVGRPGAALRSRARDLLQQGHRAFAAWLQQRWYGTRPIRRFYPLALLYGLIVWIRRRSYAGGLVTSHRLPVPVMVVGNLVVGGAGKTPTVLALVRALRARGWNPGVLCRGYGGSASTPRLVERDCPAIVCGDEPLLLMRRLQVPVAIGRQRAAAGLLLLDRHPEVDCLVCDDGLQHVALQRDIEIVVLDAARGFGNGARLPAGPLREPLGRLRVVDAIVVRTDRADGDVPLPAGLPAATLRTTLHPILGLPRPLLAGRASAGPLAWADWHGQTVHAVAGIAAPARFFAALAAHGLQVLPHAFPDHHAFTRADFQFLDERPVLMTEKDAVKCETLGLPQLWVVPLEADLDARFIDSLIPLLERARGRKTA